MRSPRSIRNAAAIAATIALTTAAPAAAWQSNLNADGSRVPAAAIPASSARTGLCSEVCSGHGYNTPAASPATPSPSSEVIDNGGYGTPSTNQATSSTARHTTGSDLEWAYLAIGGGATGLVLLVLGGTYVARRRRPEQPVARPRIAA